MIELGESNEEKIEKLRMESEKIHEEIDKLEKEEREREQKGNQKLIGKYFKRGYDFFKVLEVDSDNYISAVMVEFYASGYDDTLEIQFSNTHFESLEQINDCAWNETTKEEFEKDVVKIVMVRVNKSFGD